MNHQELLKYRLYNQQLLQPCFDNPQELVSWMGAVQAQDYAMCKWALGLRLTTGNDQLIESAIDDGELVRTHVLRPTWHLVAPADIRWLLQLTAPRIHQAAGSYYRKLDLDQRVFKKAHQVLERELRDGNHQHRGELAIALEKAKINTDDLRLTHILIQAELEGIICNGPRKGKQNSYVLLEERVPAAPLPDRETALALLARKYFQSHGPATVKDFSWWSGLTLTDTRKAVQSIAGEMEQIALGEDSYWWFPAAIPSGVKKAAYLLPNYDEYIVSYADREQLVSDRYAVILGRNNPLFNNTVIIDGQVAGTWKRTLKAKTVEVTLDIPQLPPAQQKLADNAMKRYTSFLGKD